MRFFVLTLISLVPALVFSQDTLHVSLEETEIRFLKNNLMVLAGKYNIEAQSALVIQARLWANPRITAEVNAYHPYTKEFFDAGRHGEKAFSVEQLIYLGGKRRNQISIAEKQTQIAGFELEDLLRNLRLQLRKSFYSVYYDQLTLSRYDRQLQLLSSIITAYQSQAEKGNIPMKEVLRLKAVYYQLNNDKTGLINTILDEEANLQVLLREDVFIDPNPVDDFMLQYTTDSLDVAALTMQALSLRPDYKVAQGAVELANVNYRLQKSLAIPDVTIGGTYDQQGGAFYNQTGLTLAMDLPTFNRNQGNIKYAAFSAQRIIAQRDEMKFEIGAQVNATVQKVKRVDAEYAAIDNSFRTDFESLNEGVVRNFQKRNLSLLEFVDFFVSYSESLQALNRINKARIDAFEELNSIVGTELFK